MEQLYTFSIEDHDKYGRDIVTRNGIVGIGTVIAEDTETLVVRWKGYGENPGSRYSGLYSYYPSTTEVFVYEYDDDYGRKKYRSLIEWDTRPKKKAD